MRGIWRISPSGNKTRIASLPLDVHPNGLALYRGHVYVTDHGAGRIYRAPKYGNGQPAELWLASELLAFVPNDFMAPGANGIQFYLRTAYVANSAQQTILAIDLDNDDAPVSIEVAHDFFPGCDDMAIGLFGRIYCATNPFQTVVRVDPDGSQHILFTAADGLDGPTALTFGRLFDSFSLYIANAAFPFFPGTGHGPSVLVTEVDVPGYPLR